jgi:hypothetical protein
MQSIVVLLMQCVVLVVRATEFEPSSWSVVKKSVCGYVGASTQI